MSSLPGTMRSTEHGEEPPDDVGQSSTARAVRSLIHRRSETYLLEDLSRGRCDRLFELRRRAPRRAWVHQARRRGVTVSIGRSGSAQRQPTDVAGSHRNHDDAERRRAGERKPLSNQLTERLTAERTVALQECLAGKPEAALMAVVHALALRVSIVRSFGATACLGLEEDCDAGDVRAERGRKPGGASLARRHRRTRKPADRERRALELGDRPGYRNPARSARVLWERA